MKWRLSLEGASVLTACADRMENVCVMQRTASDKRSVFWCSPLHTHTHTHTHTLTLTGRCIRDSRRRPEERRAIIQFHTCVSPTWLRLIHSGTRHWFGQVCNQLWLALTITASPAELATSMLNWLLVSVLSPWVWMFLNALSGTLWQTRFLKAWTRHTCATHVLKMRQSNCPANSLLMSLCLVHLSEQNLTFHVHFHGCLFIHLGREWTVSLYVFGRTSIQVPVFSSHLWTDCSLFWCPIVQLSVIFKTLECHLPQIPSLSILAPFLWLHSRTSHWVCISGQIHSSLPPKAHFFFFFFSFFFIAAISLLFKSTDNVFLSILLHPFQRRVQGFSVSLAHSHSLSLSPRLRASAGTPECGASLQSQLSVCNEPWWKITEWNVIIQAGLAEEHVASGWPRPW